LPLNHILFKIYSKIVKGPSKDTKILFAGMRKELEEQTTRKIFFANYRAKEETVNLIG